MHSAQTLGTCERRLGWVSDEIGDG